MGADIHMAIEVRNTYNDKKLNFNFQFGLRFNL